MRYVAAYLLAALGGKGSPSAADIEKILGSVGIEAEADKVKKIIAELKGKKLSEVIEEGSKKLASVPAGGGGAPAAAGGAPAAGKEAAKEEKKEEKKEESEESDDDMGFGLFD
ncbi:60S acidic ribosomal protein P2-like [Mya arenaria]|uniref:60S acidic ribosomal protein P2-like n=1 Tax=Mya arenaria TaxID=6604 RepID=UPI0022E7FF2B|nr:60S acidic ribosomal protein P2-like [Mya arenaria]